MLSRNIDSKSRRQRREQPLIQINRVMPKQRNIGRTFRRFGLLAAAVAAIPRLARMKPINSLLLLGTSRALVRLTSAIPDNNPYSSLHQDALEFQTKVERARGEYRPGFQDNASQTPGRVPTTQAAGASTT